MPSLATEQPRAWHSGSPQWRVELEASPMAMSTASVAPPSLATPPKDEDIRDQALGLSTAKSGKTLRLAQLDTFIMHAQQPRWQWLQRMHRNDGKKQSSRVLKAFFLEKCPLGFLKSPSATERYFFSRLSLLATGQVTRVNIQHFGGCCNSCSLPHMYQHLLRHKYCTTKKTTNCYSFFFIPSV